MVIAARAVVFVLLVRGVTRLDDQQRVVVVVGFGRNVDLQQRGAREPPDNDRERADGGVKEVERRHLGHDEPREAVPRKIRGVVGKTGRRLNHDFVAVGRACGRRGQCSAFQHSVRSVRLRGPLKRSTRQDERGRSAMASDGVATRRRGDAPAWRRGGVATRRRGDVTETS